MLNLYAVFDWLKCLVGRHRATLVYRRYTDRAYLDEVWYCCSRCPNLKPAAWIDVPSLPGYEYGVPMFVEVTDFRCPRCKGRGSYVRHFANGPHRVTCGACLT